MKDLYIETREIMKHNGINADKNLGQNFLVNEEVLDKIVKESNITNEDLIIEIGPGLGNLTKKLLEKAGKVVCIELDKRMIDILNKRFLMYDNFELINNDVLKEDLKELITKGKKEKNLKYAKVVANLPYYITTPIIMKLLEEKLDIDSITVMVQKEVADRLTAVPGEGETGAITYTINYYTQAYKIVNVPNTSFIPEPKVESSVIMLKRLNEPRVKVKSEEALFRIIKLAFMQKRKTLLNALTNGGLAEKSKIEEILNNLNIDLKIRGEKLTLEQYAQIANFEI